MRKALVIILLSLTFGMPALTRALLPAAAEAATTPTQSERLVIAAVNHERSVRGLARVSFQASLTRAARSHASELAQRGLLSHISVNGWTVGPRVRHFGYTAVGCTQWTAGETLACAKSGSLAATPQVIVKLWMGSPAHRAVLLTARLRDVGVGVVVGSDGRRYFAVDLGRRVRG